MRIFIILLIKQLTQFIRNTRNHYKGVWWVVWSYWNLKFNEITQEIESFNIPRVFFSCKIFKSNLPKLSMTKSLQFSQDTQAFVYINITTTGSPPLPFAGAQNFFYVIRSQIRSGRKISNVIKLTNCNFSLGSVDDQPRKVICNPHERNSNRPKNIKIINNIHETGWKKKLRHL